MRDEAPVLGLETVVRRAEGVVAEAAGGETVLYRSDSGKLFALNQVSEVIWNALESPSQIRTVCARLIALYRVERSQCEQETLEFIKAMIAEGLLEPA